MLIQQVFLASFESVREFRRPRPSWEWIAMNYDTKGIADSFA